ncbi:MAG TPA: aerial mycelium formation protein [Acidimicrobiia bacterium]|nr:aerial mycelium formation protein [Acidimicrobiia bacterium]
MTEPARRRRLDRILDPSYFEALDRRAIDDLRLMRGECGEVETEVSYVRRLAQARLEIIRAELERRERGGDLGELIASLPQILAGDSARSGAVGSRIVQSLAPSMSIAWNRGLERLISDSTLVNLPSLGDDELRTTIEELGKLENEVSGVRRRLHSVIDQLDLELGARLRSTPQSL